MLQEDKDFKLKRLNQAYKILVEQTREFPKRLKPIIHAKGNIWHSLYIVYAASVDAKVPSNIFLP